MNRFHKIPAAATLLLIFASLFAGKALAQRATVTGVVTEDQSGNILLGATVALDNLDEQVIRTTTDKNGLFSFGRVLPGRYLLSATFVGFEAWADTVNVPIDGNEHFRVDMIETATQMNEVVVETVRTEADRFVAGLESISPNALARIPMPDVTYDLAGYLQTLPGFVSAGDRGGQLFVRGGTPTQNLVLLDGIPLYRPFHIVGFYSAIPAEIVSYADVYAGGFGAQYGGRISSVIDISTRSGNMKRVQASASIAPFLTGLRLEMPIAEEDVSLLLSLRESVIDRLAPSVLGRDMPFRFGDFFGKLYANLSPTASVAITGIRTYDKGNVLGKNSTEALGIQRSTWNNQAYGVRYLFLPSDYPAMFEFTSHYTQMNSEFRLTQDEFRTARANSFGLKMRFHYLLGDSQLHFGIFGNMNRFTYTLNTDLDQNLSAVSSGGMFADTRFLLFGHLRIEPGIRFESFSHGISMSIGPRLRVIILPEGRQSRHQISAAWGRYYQQIVGLNNEQDVSEVFTIWSASPQDTAVPEATHFILGYRGRLLPWLELTVEGYRKWLRNLAFPVFSERVDGKTKFSQVSGTAEGIDVKIDLESRSFFANVGYSLAAVTYNRARSDVQTILIPGVVASTQIDAREFSPPHDRRHQINALAQYSFGKNRFSVRWQFGSGLPFTQVNGYYNRFDPSAITQPGALNGEGSLYVSRSTLYGDRLPTYHRLDLSYERVFIFNRAEATLQLGAINVYDRANIFSYNIFTGDRVDQFPIIPSVGLKVEVK